MSHIKTFQTKVDEGNYIDAAEIYIDYAWNYQKQFNMILETNNCKTQVFKLVQYLMYDVRYWVDPAGGTHRTDDNDPSAMYK